MKEIIEKVLLFDDHESSSKDRALSTTTIIGPNWKAKRDVMKDVLHKEHVDPMMRRSSCIGTGYHMRAEQALVGDPLVDSMERYNEKYVEEFDVWVSGKFDLVYDGHICDHKTGYGKVFAKDKLDKAVLQLSIYRWLNQDIEMKDIGYVLFVSQSVNAYESYPVNLLSIEDTDTYIKVRIKEILDEDRIDCNDGIKFNMCNYCNYDRQSCDKTLDNRTF